MYKLVNILREIQAPSTDKLTAQFIEKAQKKWGEDKYNYDLVQYVNNTKPIKILCNDSKHRQKQKEETGNEWFEQIPKNHLTGREGCPQHKVEQVDTMRQSPETFIKRAQDKWKSKYDYSLVQYVNMDTPVKILCNNLEHRKKQKEETGDEWFEQTPNNHLKGWEGCPQHKERKSITNGQRSVTDTLEELGYRKKIDFDTEYRILELPAEDGKTVLKVDFYLPALKTMIEFDGDYHFRKGGHSDSENKFRKQVSYDKMKNKYCKEHGIKLIRIGTNMTSTELLNPLKDAIKNKKPGELVLIGNYPKAGWNV